jgi:hypothetical protein
MKYAAFILLIAVISCSKSTITNKAKSSASIVGKWIQTAYLADPGDGSGTWQTDNSGSGYLIFNEDSTAQSSSVPYYGELKLFHILSDSTLTLQYADGTTFTHMYKVEGNILTLMGGCIEACGSRYKRAPTM